MTTAEQTLQAALRRARREKGLAIRRWRGRHGPDMGWVGREADEVLTMALRAWVRAERDAWAEYNAAANNS